MLKAERQTLPLSDRARAIKEHSAAVIKAERVVERARAKLFAAEQELAAHVLRLHAMTAEGAKP